MKSNKSIKLTLIILLINLLIVFPQNTKQFQGNYENGTATYQYYENENFERIFQGSFKYKGIVVDALKGKINLLITGQYKQNKKDSKWTYTLSDPALKGTTEIVTGNYTDGLMDGEWTSVTTINNTKKAVKKTVAHFKNNKITGELKFDYNAYTYKEYSTISIIGNFDESGLFQGIWTTNYTQGTIPFEELRKYRNGVLYWLLHRRLSDGKILDKIDSAGFVDQFFQNYDSIKKIAAIRNQKYVYKENPDKYSGTLDLIVTATNYWTFNNKNSYYGSISSTNPMFIIDYGYTPLNIFHEKVIINWASTREGEKQMWQEEQDSKVKIEKYKLAIQKADTTFNAKQFATAIELYQAALLIFDDPYPKAQVQKAQLFIDKEKMAKEQEQQAKDKAYSEIIVKADEALKNNKNDVAADLYQSALTIKDEQYPKDQIKFIKQIQGEEIRLKLVQEFDKLFVVIEGGTFKMGCLRSDVSCLKNEEPVHEVVINPYSISKFEVTIGQYKAFCLIKGKNVPQGTDDNLPVTNITWNDAVEFASWLGYRLPTEAEWEFAARGGINNKKSLYSGSNDIEEVAWFYENSSNTAHQAGTKKPNSLGIYDMSGNVWEWCSDYYGDYSETGDINPKGPATGTRRVKRGGSFSDTNFEVDLRITNRASEPPEFSAYSLGFRLVRQ
jgi:formylglycine-generating enzyme